MSRHKDSKETDRKILIYQPDTEVATSWTGSLTRKGTEYRVVQVGDRQQAQVSLRDEPLDFCALDLAGAADVDLYFDLRTALPEIDMLLTAASPFPKIVEDLAQTGVVIHPMEPPLSPARFYEVMLQATGWVPDADGESFPDMNTVEARLQIPRQTQRISGNLKVLLPDLVQLKCLTGSSCVLEISAGQNTGEIFFEKGNIVHSRALDLEGKDALVDIFTWHNSHFNVLAWREPEVRSIHDRWESLLLDVTQRVDEANGRAQEGVLETTADSR